MGARTTAFATAMLTGQVGIAIGILFGTGLEASYAKLFTTDAGRKFLTEGLFSKRGASLGDYIGPTRPLNASFKAINSSHGKDINTKSESAKPSLFGAPNDIKPAKKPILPKKKQQTEKQRAFFLRSQGAEDKIPGYDDGEWPAPRS